jgi:hypothetical protein
MTTDPIGTAYSRLKKLGVTDIRSDKVGAELAHICELSLNFIHQYSDMTPLESKVPGKKYQMAALKSGQKVSRPINSGLFDGSITRSDIDSILSGNTAYLAEEELQRKLYTIAMSYLVARDLVSTGDKKSPATFFEFLIGHLVAAKFGVNPTRSIAIPSLGIENTLPTDLIFDLGQGKTKIHMPVKISTRERVVQAWAHQRVLEGMHGAGRFRGIMVILTETNKQQDRSVVEVCLPGQWAAYQMYISVMYRIYYFDLPKAYEPLRDRYPYIPVWPFSRFFSEAGRIEDPSA